jgi:tellurite resistance protein
LPGLASGLQDRSEATMTKRPLLAAVLVATALAASAPGEQPPEEKKPDAAACKEMMQKREAESSALDAKLKAMNEATGQEKIEAMAAVVNMLVAQHRTMHPEGCPMMEHGAMHEMEHGKPEGATTP